MGNRTQKEIRISELPDTAHLTLNQIEHVLAGDIEPIPTHKLRDSGSREKFEMAASSPRHAVAQLLRGITDYFNYDKPDKNPAPVVAQETCDAA